MQITCDGNERKKRINFELFTLGINEDNKILYTFLLFSFFVFHKEIVDIVHAKMF